MVNRKRMQRVNVNVPILTHPCATTQSFFHPDRHGGHVWGVFATTQIVTTSRMSDIR
jgi:hypothetical protein